MVYGITSRYGADVPEWMRALSGSVRKIVTPEVMETIITKQVEKAKAGDAQAARFVMEMFAAAQTVADKDAARNAIPATAVPKIGHDEESEKTSVRRLLRSCLKEAKQLSPGELSARTGVSENLVKTVLRTSGSFRRCQSRRELWEIDPQIA